MERHFCEELATLKNTLVGMADLAGRMIDDSIRMLVDRDASVAASIMENEDKVNHLQCEVDDLCTKFIALHQPTASDLRFIIGCIKTNTDLERLADEAINVMHKAARIIVEEPLPELQLIPEMAKKASAAVKEAIRAFVSGDVLKARELIRRDKELNQSKAEATAKGFELIRADPEALRRGLDLILAARNIERIGDHVKNIAENAIFVAEGSDVRHHFDEGL
jgi:phosphate transport system protein